MNANLTFTLEPASLIDTLEAVLAIARRGGLRLAALTLQRQQVALELEADDSDLIDLFNARLHNVIGVHDIAVSDRLTRAPHLAAVNA
jgi:hypothetical protein